MTNFFSCVNELLWGAPALILILGVGLYLSLRTRFAQLRLFPEALRTFVQKFRTSGTVYEGVSPFQALCTALAATVGTGNLVGIAGAICLGGPGAVLWIWVCGMLGMVTKFAETVLALHYRVKDGDGYAGGPMYVILGGLGDRFSWLASAYCVFGLIASFGIGNAAQINAVISSANYALRRFHGFPVTSSGICLGVLLAVLVGLLLMGGARRIGSAAELLVPFVSVVYILMCVGVLIVRREQLPKALFSIVQGALSPRAVTGGVLGSAFLALRTGCSRGVFTNEAGMGTASIAHASARVRHPVEQGLMGMVEVFLDTIVICTLTALVLLSSGVPIPYGVDAGAELTVSAFASVYGEAAALLITVCLCCFAIATVLGWGLYGARCAAFLFGRPVWKVFAAAQAGMAIAASVLDTATIWQISETFNGLMVIPNLIALAVLTPQVVRLTNEYKKAGSMTVSGGNYANFHQCEPL